MPCDARYIFQHAEYLEPNKKREKVSLFGEVAFMRSRMNSRKQPVKCVSLRKY